MMPIRASIIAAAAALAAAPAAAQGTLPECRTLSADDPRPAPLTRREAADSAAAAAEERFTDTLLVDVLEGARQAGVDHPEGLIVLEIRGRRPDRVEILPWQSNVPQGLPRDVLARHASLLAALPERTRVLHLRLDPLPRDTALPVACAPRLAGATQFRDAIVRALRREPPLPSGSDPRVAVQVRMLVTRDGEVAYASLSRRGPTGTIDAAILRAARGLRFVPATWGGVPWDQWVELPVRMEVPMLPPESRRP